MYNDKNMSTRDAFKGTGVYIIRNTMVVVGGIGIGMAAGEINKI